MRQLHRHLFYKFLDFVVARIVTAEIADEPWVSGDTDTEWHQRIDLEFEINPQLDEDQKAALTQDFFRHGEKTLKFRDIRKALSGNLCRCAGYQQIAEAVLQAARSEVMS